MGSNTWIQRGFAPIKRVLPRAVTGAIRAVASAVLGPLLFSYRSGHLRSSFRSLAVSRRGEPIPWYTYPCVDFLKSRSFAGRRILELGAGQSTLWWALREAHVVSLEENIDWYRELNAKVPGNVALHHVDMRSVESCLNHIARILSGEAGFDVVIVDGLFRAEALELVIPMLNPDGALICDNAEGYGFYEALKEKGMQRVDFFGLAAGGVNPHCTAIAFREQCFMFAANVPILDPIKLY